MTITIEPLAQGERRREVRIGRTGKGYLARTRGAHVLEGPHDNRRPPRIGCAVHCPNCDPQD